MFAYFVEFKTFTITVPVSPFNWKKNIPLRFSFLNIFKQIFKKNSL